MLYKLEGSTYKLVDEFPIRLNSDGTSGYNGYWMNYVAPGDYILSAHNRTGTYQYDSVRIRVF